MREGRNKGRRKGRQAGSSAGKKDKRTIFLTCPEENKSTYNLYLTKRALDVELKTFSEEQKLKILTVVR